MKNKKGLATLQIFVFIIMVFIWIVLLGILVTIFNVTTTSLQVDVDVGQVNLKDIVDVTMGRLNTGLTTNANIIGLVIIFGMILSMIANAFAFRGEFPTLFIILDIILLVFAYIFAVYISNAYELLIHASSDLDVYITFLSQPSRFILNLPRYVGIIGAIIMIVSYISFPKKTQQEVIVGQV